MKASRCHNARTGEAHTAEAGVLAVVGSERYGRREIEKLPAALTGQEAAKMGKELLRTLRSVNSGSMDGRFRKQVIKKRQFEVSFGQRIETTLRRCYCRAAASEARRRIVKHVLIASCYPSAALTVQDVDKDNKAKTKK